MDNRIHNCIKWNHRQMCFAIARGRLTDAKRYQANIDALRSIHHG